MGVTVKMLSGGVYVLVFVIMYDWLGIVVAVMLVGGSHGSVSTMLNVEVFDFCGEDRVTKPLNVTV